jgi:predicted RNase H-like HicB family nuclease
MESKYEITVCWSKEDAAYIAKVPELSRCMADGRTRQEAVANVERVIQEWIETAKELGRPIPDSDIRHEGTNRCRQLGGAIGKLRIVENDQSHLEDFHEYMPGGG